MRLERYVREEDLQYVLKHRNLTIYRIFGYRAGRHYCPVPIKEIPEGTLQSREQIEELLNDEKNRYLQKVEAGEEKPYPYVFVMGFPEFCTIRRDSMEMKAFIVTVLRLELSGDGSSEFHYLGDEYGTSEPEYRVLINEFNEPIYYFHAYEYNNQNECPACGAYYDFEEDFHSKRKTQHMAGYACPHCGQPLDVETYIT